MVKISIITTALNAGRTIRDCLESIKGQTYPSVEHIVVDGASSDGTPATLDEYKESIARIVSEPDNGIYDGMNKGLALAAGEVVGFLNADDMYYSNDVLEKVARVFEDEKVDSCYGNLLYVDSDKTEKVIRYWNAGPFDPKKFYRGWMVPHPTFFVRRSVYEKYGNFNVTLGTAADYELILRFLLKHRISTKYLPEILIRMRSGGASNVTFKSRIQANKMDRKAWEVNGLKPYPWTVWMKPLRKAGQWFLRPKK